MNYQCYIAFHLKGNIYTLKYFLESLLCCVHVHHQCLPEKSRVQDFSWYILLQGTVSFVWTVLSIVPCSCDSPVMPQRCWFRWQNNMDGFWSLIPKQKQKISRTLINVMKIIVLYFWGFSVPYWLKSYFWLMWEDKLPERLGDAMECYLYHWCVGKREKKIPKIWV